LYFRAEQNKNAPIDSNPAASPASILEVQIKVDHFFQNGPKIDII
jgi:hypothetical protein